jgi:hypothetical protein
MAVYTITDPDTGETLRVRGDEPPDAEDIAHIFNTRRSAKIQAGPARADVRNPPPPPKPDKPEQYESAITKALVGFGTPPGVEAAQYLPAVGAAVGGAVGGPPGAGVGGIIGAGATQGINRLVGRPGTPSPEEARWPILKEGLENAALELVGGKLVPAAANKLYRSALDIPAAILERFPSLKDPAKALAARGIKEGVLVSRAAEQGRGKIPKLLEQSGKRSRQIAEAADVAGTPPTPKTAINQLDEPLAEVAANWAPDTELAQLAEYERSLNKGTPWFSMADLEEQVRKGGIRASQTYKAEQKLGVRPTIKDLADKDVTDRAREELYAKVPEIIPEKERAAQLIGLSDVLSKKKAPAPFGLLDLMGSGIGATVGATAGGPIGAAGGATIAYPIQRALRGTLPKSAAAIGLSRAARPTTEAIRFREALLDALSRADPFSLQE